MLFIWILVVIFNAGYVKSDPTLKYTGPQFADIISNVTIEAGQTLRLACVIDGLGSFKMAWVHADSHRFLTLYDRVISRDTRVKITHQKFRTWWLHIEDVEESDSGRYLCQVNTSPMIQLIANVLVVRSPTILEDQTSSDTTVRLGASASLRCKATGSPPPEIMWRREDDQDIQLGAGKVPIVRGEYLNINNVNRQHAADYTCIASNGVLPNVTKKIVLKVSFAPMFVNPEQVVGAETGSDVTLICNLESHPPSLTYWTRERDDVIPLSNSKYKIQLIQTDVHNVQMRLDIKSLRLEDFGLYACVAKNFLGEVVGTIGLYEMPKSHSSNNRTIEASESNKAKGDGHDCDSKANRPPATWSFFATTTLVILVLIV